MNWLPGMTHIRWRDNFCEARDFGAGQCASGFDHQGQDIRPACSPRGEDAEGDGWLWVNPYVALISAYECLTKRRGGQTAPNPAASLPAIAHAMPQQPVGPDRPRARRIS